MEFGDIGLALDLDGHAGQVAKLLGVVFGPHTVNNMEYVGIGLNEMDNGVGYELLGERAIYITGDKSHDEVVTLLWYNLFGSIPSDTEKSPYIKLLDTGEMSVGTLAPLAADTSFNTENINLTGLTQTGLTFI